MKNIKIFNIITIVALIGLVCASCGDYCDASCLQIGEKGEGGGKVFYHKHKGFTVKGTESFTAYYLEAALENQGISTMWISSDSIPEVTNTGTAIGTGKENTRLILAVDADAPAAKACVDYDGGGKNDWFLPSKDELNELYKAFGPAMEDLWSSSQFDSDNKYAWAQSFRSYYINQFNEYKISNFMVRAIRAF